jgi:hypothetical protein
MTRQEILAQITETIGGVPGWLDGVPDPQRDKALAAFGAAAANHCAY